MGMSASQARLLSITARLSDNEFNAQALSYSKQRLADESEQINNDYLEALKATKLQIVTGFNGSSPSYEDISYSTITGFNTVACGRQYLVTDAAGKIVVEQKYANAFEAGNGDVNIFLAELGVIQTPSKATIKASEENGTDLVHEAWDKYFASVYGTAEAYYEKEHRGESNITFDYSSENLFGGYATAQVTNTFNLSYVAVTSETGTTNQWQYTDKDNKTYVRQDDDTLVYTDDAGKKITLQDSDGKDVVVTNDELPKNPKAGESTYEKNVECSNKVLNFEGTSAEQRELYDYAVALTTQQKSENGYEGKPLTNTEELESGLIDYYKNICNQMATCGYVVGTDIKDNTVFEDKLQKGEYLLKYYSSTDNDFVSTTLSDDDAIEEVEDEKQITLAEAKYTSENTRLENEDNKIDLELKKLDSEHNALQTEYDSVKTVIDKNVEKTFNIFS